MNAVQCDYCGKFAPNPIDNPRFVGRYASKLPDDWFACVVASGGYREGTMADEDGEFCSRECISAHFAKPVPA